MGTSGGGSSLAAPMADSGGRAVLVGVRKGKERGGGVIGLTTRRGGFAQASWPTGATAWARGGRRRAAAGGQWSKAVHAPVSAMRPRGTGLDS
jgi:hypothetical protein